MKNLILTICLSVAVSFTFAQIDVVGPAGNVGMGITNPTEKLDINGKLKVRGDQIFLGSDAGFRFLRTATGSSRFIHSGNAQYQFISNNNADITFFTNGNTLRAAIRAGTGDLAISSSFARKPGGGMWSTLSDKRLKDDVIEYSDGLEEIMKIRPVSFKYNEKAKFSSDHTHIGIIAQELEKVAPYMVSDYDLKDYSEDVAKKTDTYKSVDPSAFTYMLINAVQEQQEIISEQNSKIEKLTISLKDLTDKFDQVNESSSFMLIDGDMEKGKLAQNTPNPLTNSTRIEYYIPSNATKAIIQVYDLSGKLFKSVDINEKGYGSLDLKVKNIASGLYTYALEIDGNSIDTKKMVIK